MDATQMISDSILESDEEENEEENRTKRGRPLAKLCILKNEHIPETELPLFLGENVLGRDPNTCTLPLPAPSISKRHAKICISVYRRKGRHGEADTEALVWDLGSMNGTRKGRLKLTPNVRYALSECDSLVVADIPCQYVSCAADTAFSQGDFKTPVSRNSGVKARLPDASGEKGGDTNTDSKTRVNGGTKARVSIPDVEDRRKSPVGSRGLSFEQTPTQPQGTLVPESDSDSDGERGRGAERRRKALVSHSDSYKSSPSCSTFLTPTNKIVPESEDEGPITPSTSAINRPHRHVNFSKEETDVDVGRRQPKEKKAIVDDSEEGEGMEGERAARGVRQSEESGQHVPVEQESNVSLTGEDELPVSTPAVLTGAIPAFNMDSDTDVEGEEDGAPAGPVTLNTNPHTDQPPDTAQFHMDSDTDVDEDDDALGKVPKSVPSSADNTKPPPVISVIQPEAFTMDSDTDVDDDDAAVSDAASKAKPVSFQSTDAADSAPSTQPKDFHLDSDTDVDEEEEEECGTINKCSEIDQIPTRLDIEPTGPESAAAAPHSLHLDSDTDDEAIAAPAISEPSVVSAVTASCTAAVAGADLDVLSDSDTDVEDDSPLVIPFVATTLSFAPDAASEALQSDSDAGTDVDESCTPPAGDGVNPADHGMDSDTDVEDKEVDFGGLGEGQIPSLDRENTNEFLVPALQNCSTPVQLPEGEAKDMDTQDFQSPSSGPFRRALAPALRPKVLSPSSDSQEDEDFVVAETQSFILQTRDCGGNPPEDHLHGQAQALAMESTQAFASVEAGVNLEATQAYAAISNADRASLENDSNLEATQAYGEDEEPAGCSPTYEKEDQVDLALEATQAYIPEPSSDSEDETHEDERKDMTTAETQPLDFPTSSTLAIAETQPMSVFEEEERLDEENLVSSVLHVKRRPQNETGEREEQGEAAQPQAVAETQPMHASDHEESDEEGLIAGPRKRKAKPLQPGEEPAQRLTSSLGETQPMHIGVDETQPMAMSGNDESDEEDVIQGPRKRKAKPLQLEEEQTQMFTNSELSAVETQPVDSGECEESDEEDSFPGPRKRKAKPLQLEEEQTQSLTSSEVPAAETQPMGTCEGAQSDEEDSIPGPRKRKAKPLQIQEEESQTITNSEASTVETQPLETQTGPQPQRGKGAQSEAGTSGITVRGKRGTRARSREEDEQEECSDPPKRQMRGKSKALPTTRGRRGTPRPDEDESEKEEKVEQAMRPRGKKSTREQKIDGEEGERNKNAENESLIKEQEEGTLGEEKDVTKLGQQMEKERRETNGRERKQEEGQHSREEQETLERERKEKEEQERLQAENAKRLRLEQERAEKETTERQRKEREEKERADKTQKKKEQLEREIKEREEKERVECEKAEREEKERLEREKIEIEKERKQQEEKERLETAKRELKERLEREEQERQARLETEAKEREQRERLEKEKQEKEAKEKQIKEQQENKEEENEPKAPARGRRAARRTTAAPKPEPDPTNDDVPARRTRSRSNSSNSVNSERSASSVDTQQSGGRGRGRGAKRTSEPPRAATARSSTRRRTVAAEPTDQDRSETAPQGGLSRSNSNNSLNSEISSCSLSSQSRGRGGRQRGRGRKTEADSIPPFTSQSDQNSAPKATTRGRRSVKAEGSSNVVSHEDDIEKADSQQASTTRGRRRANGNASEPAGAGEEDPSNQEEGCANEEPLPPKRNVRGRGQKAVKSETVEAAVAPAVSDGDQAKDKRTGRKRESEANAEEDSSSSSKISKGKEKTQTAQAADGEAKGETKGNTAVQANRRGRASTAQAKKNAKEEEESEKMEEEAVDRRGRGRSSAIQKKRKEEQEDSGTSVDQDTHVEASEQPQTPTSRASRKRQAPPDSSPVAKTPRSSSASPAASGRFRAASQACKVLFTGVMDEAGERVLARLGGSMAKGVADMNFLVTDKVRRTVKFLCAVAKGVPIVTTHWLEKSGKAGSFLSPNAFAVKDPEQEKKFNFCLQESLRIASSQLLLKGYEIHVTKSVKPEPVQMKDIITCSGATFLAKMPSSHKPQTVVISCEEDWSLCRPALSASVPVVTAEFILTGILQQKLDFQTHSLPAPASHLQPAGGRGRGKKKC